MTTSGNCPGCDHFCLEQNDDGRNWACPHCRGVFLPVESLSEELLEEARPAPAATEDSRPVDCPACGGALVVRFLGENPLRRCEACDGVWLDAPAVDNNEASGAVATVSRYLLYSLSLPERAVRSSIGLAAGAAKETAAFLVPRAFQDSKTYHVVVRNSLRFLTRDVAGVTGPTGDDSPEIEGFLARKAVGNFVDAAGLYTLHLSPLWMLVAVSDIAQGTRAYLNALSLELKQKGLIAENSTIDNVEDLLTAVQNASGEAAGLFDTPPLSVEQLRNSLEKTRDSITSINPAEVIPDSELNGYWNEMKDIATRENISLVGVSGALTMHTLQRIGNVSQGTLTGLQLAGGLFNRHVVGHYLESLQAVNDQGFYAMIRESSGPYIDAVWNNFSTDRHTWTEELLSGRALENGYQAILGWFDGDSKEESTQA